MSTYLTRYLDEWDLITFQQLGTEYAMGDMLGANLFLSNTLQFDPQISLTLPAAPSPKSVIGPPPWRIVTQTT